MFGAGVSISVSNRPIRFVEAAVRFLALPSTSWLIAGSTDKRWSSIFV